GWYTAPFGQGERLTCELGNPYLHETLWIDGLTTAYPFFANALRFTWDPGNSGFSVVRETLLNQHFTLLRSTLTIPSRVNGQPVITFLNQSFERATNITRVNIPDTVRVLQPRAFDLSPNIEYFNIYRAFDNFRIYFDSYDGIIYRIETYNDLYDGEVISRRLYMFPIARGGHITIPSLVTIIPDRFFANAVNLEKVTLNREIEEIGISAFYRAINLTEVEIPDDTRLMTIRSEAFRNTALTSFAVPGTVRDRGNFLQANFIPGIGNAAFMDTNLTTFEFVSGTNYPLTLQGGTNDISMFRGVSQLQSIEIPSRVRHIGGFVFTRMAQLNSVTIEDGALPLTLGNVMLDASNNIIVGSGTDQELFTRGTIRGPIAPITTITLPARTTIIGRGAFYGESNLQTINFASTPQGQTVLDLIIGNNAFRNAHNLTSIEIPSRTTVIAPNAFDGSRNLNTVTFLPGSTPLEIGTRAFAGAVPNRTAFSIPARATQIGENVFQGNPILSNITFVNDPDLQLPLVLFINAFQGLPSLITITLPARTVSIDYSAVAGDAITAFSNTLNLVNINVDSGGTHFSSREGILLNAAGYELVFLPRGRRGNFEIPEGITAIGASALRNHDQIQTLTIRYGITRIGDSAFRNNRFSTLIFEGRQDGYDAQAELVIHQNAFRDNASLTSIEFQTSSLVREIGVNAFHSTGLQNLTLPNTINIIRASAFDNNRALQTVSFDSRPLQTGDTALTIEDNAFRNAISLDEITLPQHVSTINAAAVTGAINLQNIFVNAANPHFQSINGVVYNRVTVEGVHNVATTIVIYPQGRQGAFDDMPSTVTHIAIATFRGFTRLTGITIPAGVEYIGAYAFDGAVNLLRIDFLETPQTAELLLEIGSNAFRNTPSLAGLSITRRLSAIGANAFRGVTGLQSIRLSSELTEIGEDAFRDATGLTTVTFELGESALRHIGRRAFQNTTSLTEFTLPHNVVNNTRESIFILGVSAFQNSAISSFTLPNYVGTYRNVYIWNYAAANPPAPPANWHNGWRIHDFIGNSVFMGTNITEITIPANVTRIAQDAFRDTPLQTVYFAFGSRLTHIGGNSWLTGATPNFDPANAASRVFQNTPDLRNIRLLNATNQPGTENLLPSGATTIWVDTFRYSGIQTLALPNMLRIHNGMFRGSSIQNIVIASTVTEIGTDAFRDATSLQTVTFDGNSGLLGIFNDAFRGTTALTNLTLPSGLLAINRRAFWGTGLTTLTIPQSVERLGGNNSTTVAPATGDAAGAGLIAYSNIRYVIFEDDLNTVAGPAMFIQGGNLGLATVGEANIPMFARAPELREVHLPRRVANTNTAGLPTALQFGIGSWQFAENPNLHTVTFGGGIMPLSIGASAFANSGLRGSDRVLGLAGENNMLILPGRLVAGGTVAAPLPPVAVTAFRGTRVTGFAIAGENDAGFTGPLRSRDGVLYNNTFTTLMQFPYYRAGTFEIPNTVSFIGNDSFAEVRNLTSVTFETGNDQLDLLIGDRAFQGSRITAISFPIRLIAINNAAFENARQLNSVTFADNARLRRIGGRDTVSAATNAGFTNMTVGLTTHLETGLPTTLAGTNAVFRNTTSLTSINLPASLQILGNNAFEGSGLTTVTIEEDNVLRQIGAGAFIRGPQITNINAFLSSIPNLARIGAFAFAGALAPSVTQLVIPTTVIQLENAAFRHNHSLQIVRFEEVFEEYEYEDEEGETQIGTRFVRGSRIGGLLGAAYGATNRGFFNSGGPTVPADFDGTTGGAFSHNNNLQRLYLPNRMPGFGDPRTTQTRYGRGSFASSFADQFAGLPSLAYVGIVQSDSRTGYGGLNANFLSRDGILYTSRWIDWGTDNHSDRSGWWIHQTVGTLTEGEPEGVNAVQYLVLRPPAHHSSGSFIIPNGITNIRESAFDPHINNTGNVSSVWNNTITHITIPGSVTHIGLRAFSHLAALQTVTFLPGEKDLFFGGFWNGGSDLVGQIAPAGNVNNWGLGAFFRSGLTSIEIPARFSATTPYAGNPMTNLWHGRMTFVESNLKYVTFEEGFNYTTLPCGFFMGTQIEEIVLPDSITRIGTSAFANTPYLRSVTMPQSISYIGRAAFQIWDTFEGSSPVLLDIYLPNDTIRFAQDVFRNRQQLSMSLPANIYREMGANTAINPWHGVPEIAIGLFQDSGLSGDIVIPYGITAIRNNAFRGTNITSIEIPSTVTIIEPHAFRDTPYLTTVTIADGSQLETIGDHAFNGSALESIALPAVTRRLGTEAFANTPNLTTITLSHAIHSATLAGAAAGGLGQGVFRDATGLEEVIILGNIEQIPNNMFNGATNLSNVQFPTDINAIGTDAFRYTALTSFTIPASVTNIGGAGINATNVFGGMRYLQSFEVASGNPNFVALDGVLYSMCRTVLIAYPAQLMPGEGMGELEGVLQIPDAVTRIANRAFLGARYVRRLLQHSLALVELGTFAFMDSGLEEFDFPNAFTNFVSAGGHSNIPEGLFLGSPLKHFVLYSHVSQIWQSAFAGTKLESFHFHSRITRVEAGAFAGTRYLTEVTFEPSAMVNLNTGVSVAPTNNGSIFVAGDRSIREGDGYRNISWGNRPGVFAGSALESFTFSESERGGIAAFMFEDAENLHTVNLSSELGTHNAVATHLGQSAFRGTAITSLNLPDTIRTIGSHAFAETTNLTNLTMPGLVAFTNETSTTGGHRFISALAPRTSDIRHGVGVFRGSALTNITLPESFIGHETNYANIGDIWHFGTGTWLQTRTLGDYIFADMPNLQSVTILGTFESTGLGSFSNTPNLQTVTLPNSTSIIGRRTFLNSGITNLTLPTGLRMIGYSAFEGTTELTNLVISQSVTNVHINAFSGWTVGQELRFAASAPGLFWQFNWNANNNATIVWGWSA
ncbi:MAG: leucine-rich repeat domain-containing protein, partial [Firmicutes bacterium]|nr:leucine-rich repeat domain-containing protein [Bacillota bacterium]